MLFLFLISFVFLFRFYRCFFSVSSCHSLISFPIVWLIVLIFILACPCYPCDSSCASCVVGHPQQCLSCYKSAPILFFPEFACSNKLATPDYFCYNSVCIGLISISPNKITVPTASSLSLLAVYDTRFLSYPSNFPSLSTLNFTWNIFSNSSVLDSLSNTTSDRISQLRYRFLEIPAFALPVAKYIFQVRLFFWYQTSSRDIVGTFASVVSQATVSVVPSDLVAVIDGGDRSVALQRQEEEQMKERKRCLVILLLA